MLARAKKVFNLVLEDLNDLEEYHKKGKQRDCIQKLFHIYENCINIIKDLLNNRPERFSHERKTGLFDLYHSLGILKNDYSETHKYLDKLRKSAAFGDYASTPVPINLDFEKAICEAKSLIKEVEGILNSHLG